jgi:uncharacterized membrane protein
VGFRDPEEADRILLKLSKLKRINDAFVKSPAETIAPNSSALFVLVRKVQPEKVLAELPGVKGKVLRTSLLHRNRRKSFRKLLKVQRYRPQVDRLKLTVTI